MLLPFEQIFNNCLTLWQTQSRHLNVMKINKSHFPFKMMGSLFLF